MEVSSKTWKAFGNGIPPFNGRVNAVVSVDGDIYMAGYFRGLSSYFTVLLAVDSSHEFISCRGLLSWVGSL